MWGWLAMADSFQAQVEKWANQTTRDLELIFKESAQEVFSKAQTPVAQGGNMPKETGFLQNSFVSALNGTTSLKGPDSYVLAIAGAKLGDVVFGGWTAEYAPRIEFGFSGQDSLGRTYNQDGRGFVRKAAMQWQQIVQRNAAKVRAK